MIILSNYIDYFIKLAQKGVVDDFAGTFDQAFSEWIVRFCNAELNNPKNPPPDVINVRFITNIFLMTRDYQKPQIASVSIILADPKNVPGGSKEANDWAQKIIYGPNNQPTRQLNEWIKTARQILVNNKKKINEVYEKNKKLNPVPDHVVATWTKHEFSA